MVPHVEGTLVQLNSCWSPPRYKGHYCAVQILAMTGIVVVHRYHSWEGILIVSALWWLV